MRVAQRQECAAMFEKNLTLLSPWLKEAVLNLEEEVFQQTIEITYTEDGYPICWYHRGGKRFRLNSEHPVEEAKDWYRGISKQGTGVLFLFGSGFGYPLFEIFEQKQPNTLVVLVEQDLYLFKAMLQYFDLEPILETNKIAFLIGDSDYFASAFEHLFFNTFFVSCTVPMLAFTYSAKRNFKAEYQAVFQYIFTQLSLLVFYVGNDHQDNLIGFCNMLGNCKEVLKNPSIGCLKNQYQDVPAFIVANGPSLDQNMQELKKIQGKGLIISLESTILPLLKNEIKPDILTIIERTKNTYRFHFKDREYPADIALLCLALVDQHVFPSFQGEKIPIFRQREVINEWIDHFLGDGSKIDAGANVSHLALELATYLGANPIVFVGQDFAYGPDKKTHSKDSVYSEEVGKQSKEIVQSRPVVYVEGNDGTQLASNQLWVDFRLGLERKIAVHSDYLFLNATEGGAKIKGTTCVKLQDAIRQYCTTPLSCRVNETIAENRMQNTHAQKKEQLQAFIESIQHYVKVFRDLLQESIEGKRACQNMLQLVQKEEPMKHYEQLERVYQNNMDAFHHYLKYGLTRSFTQQAIFADYYLINRHGNIDTPEKIIEIFKLQYQLFSHLNLICQSVSVHFENAKQLMEDLYAELGDGDAKE